MISPVGLVDVVYNSRSPGQAVHAPLTPIPVAGPFDRIGVDIIQFLRSDLGNQYVVMFMDYLTKWPEVYPTPDQTAATVANLLVREIVNRHRVPSKLLSDTTAYHPQTDRLVERFNRTLTTMLAKTVERGGRDWDQRLPLVLFAYRASQQQSTLESSFFYFMGETLALTLTLQCTP